VSSTPVALCVNTGSSSLKVALGDEAGVSERRDIHLDGPDALPGALDDASVNGGRADQSGAAPEVT